MVILDSHGDLYSSIDSYNNVSQKSVDEQCTFYLFVLYLFVYTATKIYLV